MGSSRLARKHEPTGAVLSIKSSAAIRMLRSFLLLVTMKIMKMQDSAKDLDAGLDVFLVLCLRLSGDATERHLGDELPGIRHREHLLDRLVDDGVVVLEVGAAPSRC